MLHQEDRRPRLECACERGGHRVPCSSDALENRHVLVSCEAVCAAHHLAARGLTAAPLVPCRLSGTGSVLRVLFIEADDVPHVLHRAWQSRSAEVPVPAVHTHGHICVHAFSAFPSPSTSPSPSPLRSRRHRGCVDGLVHTPVLIRSCNSHV
jgi:hypothetical protein